MVLLPWFAAAIASSLALTALVCGTNGALSAFLLLGLLVGLPQAVLLHRHWPGFPAGAWVIATIVGGMASYVVGFIAVLGLLVLADAVLRLPPSTSDSWAGSAIVVMAGAPGGAAIGLCQLAVLGRRVAATPWLLANAVGGAAIAPFAYSILYVACEAKASLFVLPLPFLALCSGALYGVVTALPLQRADPRAPAASP